jgi:uncharacterized protein YbcI
MAEVEKAEIEISREIERVHDEAYGGGLRNVNVQVMDDLVVVVMDVDFNRAESTLVDAGYAESVRKSREEFQSAIAPTFKAIVERATGRTVDAFASRMMMDPPWSAEVFRLAPRNP